MYIRREIGEKKAKKTEKKIKLFQFNIFLFIIISFSKSFSLLIISSYVSLSVKQRFHELSLKALILFY